MSGLVDGKLAPPPFGIRCVCSEYPGSKGFIEPFRMNDPDVAWDQIGVLVEMMPRTTIEERTDSYIRALTHTKVFRFPDVIEFRLDRDAKIIHMRSCSGVGIVDLGVNRRRMESLRLELVELSHCTDP